jgi:LDH2 family malate/lactate/ureidoglycolate dehydrogenase
MAGAIKTFGGHKGSGLALIVQIFAGALVQADSFDDKSDNAGDLVMAIDPDILTTKALFTKEVSSVAKRLKTARKIDNSQEILVPGERANVFYKRVMTEGEIEVEDNLLAELRKSSA